LVNPDRVADADKNRKLALKSNVVLTSETQTVGGAKTFSSDVTVPNLVVGDGGTIGSASDTDAITISSGGDVAFSQDVTIKDGGTIGSASDPDAITIASGGDVTISQDAIVTGDLDVSNITVDDDGTIGSASATSAITIDSSGNVGIGTSSPSEELDVNGTVQATSFSGVQYSQFLLPNTGAYSDDAYVDGISFTATGDEVYFLWFVPASCTSIVSMRLLTQHGGNSSSTPWTLTVTGQTYPLFGLTSGSASSSQTINLAVISNGRRQAYNVTSWPSDLGANRQVIFRVEGTENVGGTAVIFQGMEIVWKA